MAAILKWLKKFNLNSHLSNTKVLMDQYLLIGTLTL